MAGSGLLTFAVLEGGFRLYEALRLRAAGELWAVYDETVGYRNNPAYGDHNAAGFRDRPLTPKNERFRIVVLGDSVAYYGDDRDDTFPALLRSQLNGSSVDERFDVVNTGVRGWTTWQQVRFFEARVDTLAPDLVLVALVLNDGHQILHAFDVEDGQIVGQGYDFAPAVIAQVDSWLYQTLRRSHFLVWLRRQLSRIDADAVGGADGYTFEFRPDFRTAWLDAPWKQIEEQLERLRTLGAQRGFDVGIIVFPFGDQYREDYLSRDRDYVLKPQRELASLTGRLGLPLFDLYPELDATTDLLEDGIHLTASGRQHVATYLAESLSDTGLLARDP